MEYLKIKMSLEEIKTLTVNKFRNIIKQSIKQRALEYLIEKRGTKGEEIVYSSIQMADYLMRKIC